MLLGSVRRKNCPVCHSFVITLFLKCFTYQCVLEDVAEGRKEGKREGGLVMRQDSVG